MPKLPTTPVTVKFLGAVRGIGGSMLAVEAGARQILLDCGRPIRGSGASFPVDPTAVSAIVISHAHQDHAGWLVDFCEAGFVGPVYSTNATRAILAVQIADTLRWRRSVVGVDEIIERVRGVEFGAATQLFADVVVTLHPAGHLLGAAGVQLHCYGRSVYFTGDLGRGDSPLYPPPAPFPNADLIISESTYGDREPELYSVASARLAKVAQATSADGGRLIVPAFSLGRIQLVLVAIARLVQLGEWPELPIFVDSATAHAFAELHVRFRHELRDPSVVNGWNKVEYALTDEQSVRLAQETEPAVVLVAGGMADSVRARRHLKALIDDPRCRIALVSFQAPETIGWRLLQPGPKVKFDGRSWNKWAEVVELGGFSGHAGQLELISHLAAHGQAGVPIRLVHGELAASQALAEALRDVGCNDVEIPEIGTIHRFQL